MINKILVKLSDNPGAQFWIGFLFGPTGLMILDLIFGNDKEE